MSFCRSVIVQWIVVFVVCFFHNNFVKAEHKIPVDYVYVAAIVTLATVSVSACIVARSVCSLTEEASHTLTEMKQLTHKINGQVKLVKKVSKPASEYLEKIAQDLLTYSQQNSVTSIPKSISQALVLLTSDNFKEFFAYILKLFFVSMTEAEHEVAKKNKRVIKTIPDVFDICLHKVVDALLANKGQLLMPVVGTAIEKYVHAQGTETRKNMKKTAQEASCVVS